LGDLSFGPQPFIADIIPVQPQELDNMAEIFASTLPEDAFSPVDIQGFLLERKKDAERTLQDMEGWRDEQTKAKKRREETAI